jgi:hypothetical protein
LGYFHLFGSLVADAEVGTDVPDAKVRPWLMLPSVNCFSHGGETEKRLVPDVPAATSVHGPQTLPRPSSDSDDLHGRHLAHRLAAHRGKDRAVPLHGLRDERVTNYPQEPGDPREWGGRRYPRGKITSEEVAWALVVILGLVVAAFIADRL